MNNTINTPPNRSDTTATIQLSAFVLILVKYDKQNTKNIWKKACLNRLQIDVSAKNIESARAHRSCVLESLDKP